MVCEVRGRVFRARFHTPNHAHDASKSLRSKIEIQENRSNIKIREIEIFHFRKFGSAIWADIDLPCSPMSGTLRFSLKLHPIIAFRVLDKRETGPEDTRWSRGPLPTVPDAATITTPLKTSKIIKNHEKAPKSAKMLQNGIWSCLPPAKISFGRSNGSGRDQ